MGTRPCSPDAIACWVWKAGPGTSRKDSGWQSLRLVHDGQEGDLELARILAWQIAEGTSPTSADASPSHKKTWPLEELREGLIRIGKRYGLEDQSANPRGARTKRRHLRVSSAA